MTLTLGHLELALDGLYAVKRGSRNYSKSTRSQWPKNLRHEVSIYIRISKLVQFHTGSNCERLLAISTVFEQ